MNGDSKCSFWTPWIPGWPLAGIREVYYVLNKQWKTKYEKLCSQHWNCDSIVTLWVDCPEGYYGASLCCQMEQGLALLHGMNTKYKT